MPESKILCAFCNAVLTEVEIMDLYKSQGCETCDYGSSYSGKIEIRCPQCKRVVYIKEFKNKS